MALIEQFIFLKVAISMAEFSEGDNLTLNRFGNSASEKSGNQTRLTLELI